MGMPSIPSPIRAGLGLLDTTLTKARDLVDRAPELPMQVVGNALQLTMKAQQTFTELTIRGDEVIGRLRGAPAEPPSWATFDDELPTSSSTDLLTDDLGAGSNLSRFDSVTDADVSPADDLAEEYSAISSADSMAGLSGAHNLDDLGSLVGLAETMLEESSQPPVEAPAAKRARAIVPPTKKPPAKKTPAKKAPAAKNPPLKETSPTKKSAPPSKATAAKAGPAKQVRPAKAIPIAKPTAKVVPIAKAPAKAIPIAKPPAKKSSAKTSPAKQTSAGKSTARPVSKFDLAGDLQAALDEPIES
ncbi:MAG: hypothetical protein JWM76_872 [Pseudonocardiales bacterium]|nr:hypothetical protein [Pseudonocardiales bacterium]